jgi:uncharacterized membrane protein YbaN (DUF454 family)
MRFVWAALGCICIGLATIGVILPLLPTVPFLLLAAFCFARSSERLHQWMLSHPQFGPPIQDWQSSGAINPKAKRMATLSVVVVFGLSIVLGLRPMILIIQGITLSCVMLFIWTRPNA